MGEMVEESRSMNPDYCLSRAEECELLAREAQDPKLVRELLAMAEDWRLAALDAANDNPSGDWGRRSEPEGDGESPRRRG